ncbi:MAG: hypothetical protein IT531_00095 [Burkholderiales bacterium]|nr:hypothetical protein [Burkholderiales bacterium]
MKRYAICKIIGDGQEPETAYRPAIHDIIDPRSGLRAFAYVTAIASNPDGTPVHDWCIVLASGKNFALAAGNPDIDLLPDYPLDVKVSAMATPTKTAAFGRLMARSIDVSDLSSADGYRDLIRALGRKQDAAFHEDAFDIADD